MAFIFTPLKTYFGSVTRYEYTTLPLYVSNNYILPISEVVTVDTPFTIESSTTPTISNVFPFHKADTTVLHTGEIVDNIIFVLYNTATSLRFCKINKTTLVQISDAEVHSSTVTDAVVFQSTYTADTNSHELILIYHDGTTIYKKLYTSSSWSVASTISLAGTSTLSDFIGCNSAVNVILADGSFSNIAIVSLTSGSSNQLVQIGVDITSGSLSIAFVKDDAVFFPDQPLVVDGVKLFSFNGSERGCLCALHDDNKVYPITSSAFLSDAYIDIDSDFAENNFKVIGDEFHLVGYDVSDSKIERKAVYKYEKAYYTNNTKTLEYKLNTPTDTTTDVFYPVDISIGALSNMSLEFGYYISSVWTTLGSLPISSTIHEYHLVILMAEASLRLGTHMRISTALSTPFGFTSLTIKVDGSPVLELDGFVTTVGTQVNNKGDSFPCYVPTSEIDKYALQPATTMITNSSHSFIGDDGSALFVWRETAGVDDICLMRESDNFRTNLFRDASHTATVGTPHPLMLFKMSDYYIVGVSLNTDFYILKLDADSNLRLGGTQELSTSIFPTNYIAYHSDIINSGGVVAGELFATCTVEATLGDAPYGLVMFGQQHLDFHRVGDKIATSKQITSYVVDTDSSDTKYRYDEVECIMVADVEGTYIEKAIQEYVQDSTTELEAYVETANILYDPMMQSKMIDDSTIKTLVSLAVSKHPAIIQWASDSNYITNNYEHWIETGSPEETSDMDNDAIHMAGTKQVVVKEVVVDSNESTAFRLRITVGLTDIDDVAVYDDFRVFFVQIKTAEDYSIGGDNA